jgi:hypothetical protein
MSVYFAQVGRYIKIGYSTNPERRVRNLFKSTTRYGAPQDAPTELADRHLIRAIDGDTGTEFQIHRALNDFRVFGEWFIDEPEVRDFIATAGDADDYEPVRRPAGIYDWQADPILGPTAEDEERLAHALDRIFAPTKLRGGVSPASPRPDFLRRLCPSLSGRRGNTKQTAKPRPHRQSRTGASHNSTRRVAAHMSTSTYAHLAPSSHITLDRGDRADANHVALSIHPSAYYPGTTVDLITSFDHGFANLADFWQAVADMAHTLAVRCDELARAEAGAA